MEENNVLLQFGSVTAAAAAKLLQSCLTLCDPIDGNPPASPIPGILQARTLEWVAISFSNAWKWKEKVKSLSHVRLLETPMDCSPPGSSIHGIFQARVQEWDATAFSQFGHSRVQFCDTMDCSTPDLPVLHYLLEFAQIHVHRVGDAIPASHCPLAPSHPASIFPSTKVFSNESTLCIRWPNIGVSASISVLWMNIQSWFPLGLTGLIILMPKGLSRALSSTTVQKHQFSSAQLSLWLSSHTWLLEKP